MIKYITFILVSTLALVRAVTIEECGINDISVNGAGDVTLCNHVIKNAVLVNLTSVLSTASVLQSNCEIKDCDDYNSDTECNALSFCQWNSSEISCERKSGCNGYGYADSCNAQSTCQWNEDSSSCNDRCVYYTSSSECNNLDECTWGNSKCSTVCANYNEDTCVSNKDCYWADYANVCGNKKCTSLAAREVYDSEQSCNEVPTCEWDSDSNACSYKLYTSTECLAFTTSDECDDAYNAGCTWSGYDSECIISCDNRFDTETECNADAHCYWLNNLNRCFTNSCSDYTSEQNCDERQTCKWNNVQELCIDNPTTTSCLPIEENDCYMTNGCQWSYGDSECVANCYNNYDTQSDCDAVSECRWLSNKCNTRSCYDYGSQENCDARAQCEWDTTGYFCKPTN